MLGVLDALRSLAAAVFPEFFFDNIPADRVSFCHGYNSRLLFLIYICYEQSLNGPFCVDFFTSIFFHLNNTVSPYSITNYF